MSLINHRNAIDRIDHEILRLLAERNGYSIKIADHKKRSGLAVFDPVRELAQLRRLLSAKPDNIPASSILKIWRELITLSIALQYPDFNIVYPSNINNNLYQHLRDYFGTSLQLHPVESPAQVVQQPKQSSTETILALPLSDLYQLSPKLTDWFLFTMLPLTEQKLNNLLQPPAQSDEQMPLPQSVWPQHLALFSRNEYPIGRWRLFQLHTTPAQFILVPAEQTNLPQFLPPAGHFVHGGIDI